MIAVTMTAASELKKGDLIKTSRGRGLVSALKIVEGVVYADIGRGFMPLADYVTVISQTPR